MSTPTMTFQIECTGYNVTGDWCQHNDDHILLCLIGWNSSRKRYEALAGGIAELTGMSTLVFEYSGHGESDMDIAKTRPAQHFLEVICVFDWLKAQYPKAKITVMGSSYGGFMATQLTKYREFDNLILRVPAIYRPQDFYTLNGELMSPEGQANTYQYRQDAEALAKHPLLARASTFKGKTLVVVHEKDEQVPAETTDAYIKAFSAEVYTAKNFTHSLPGVKDTDLKPYYQDISESLVD